MWSDNETSTDFLNFSETAEQITRILKRPDLRPISLGVFGGWGSGKSSLIKMVQARLESTDLRGDFLAVNFDAWLFQDYDDAKSALFETIGRKIEEAAKNNVDLRKKVKSFLSKIDTLRVVGLAAEMGSAALGLPTLGFLSKGIEYLRGKPTDTEENSPSPYLTVTEFRDEFRDILSELGKSLVVVIDNLDRCLHENAIHSLEAVRLLLFVDNISFIIAADEEMIRQAVQHHYQTSTERLTTDYLDKLVQFPIRVPRPGIVEIRSYLFLLMLDDLSIRKPELSEDIRESIRDKISSNLRHQWKEDYIDFKSIVNLLPDESETRRLSKDYYDIAERVSPLLVYSNKVLGNPRIVKRLMNSIRFRAILAESHGIPLDEQIIAKVSLFERCCSEASSSELYRLITNSSSGKIKEIGVFEASDTIKDVSEKKLVPKAWKDEAEFIFEWSKLPPSLSEVDLRPMAYLAKRTSSRVFVSAGSLSPQTEEALKELIKINKESSPAAREILKRILPNELVPAMQSIIDSLRLVSDWSKAPEGYHAALIIAGNSSEAAKLFVSFVKSRKINKPWLSASLAKKEWWEK